mmetsp:Transcript_17435/g.55196  ORF Transcript_17435/g.55196 Transcript_17435/m.55196 type:complete len:233 (-) Transcript_17435:283-981(-)
MLEATVMAVGDGPIREKRSKHKVNLRLHIIITHHVQVRLLLASEGCIGEVFSSCGGSHRECECIAAAAHALPLLLQLLLEIRLEGRVHDLIADGFSASHQLVNIRVDGLITQFIVDEGIDPAFVEKFLVGKRSCAEAAWHRHTDIRELRDHLPKRSAFAAHFINVGVAELLQRDAHPRVLFATTCLANKLHTSRFCTGHTLCSARPAAGSAYGNCRKPGNDGCPTECLCCKR